MRLLGLVLVAAIIATPAARAQAPAGGLVLGDTPATVPGPCMGVQAGSAASYGCLNDAQKALVRRNQQGLQQAVPSANSPAPALGLYNQSATHERLGANFGHSTVPARPPPPVYASPLIHH